MEHKRTCRSNKGSKSNKEEEQVDNSNFRFGTLEDLNNIAEGAMRRSS
jgi:hypothetical protein